MTGTRDTVDTNRQAALEWRIKALEQKLEETIGTVNELLHAFKKMHEILTKEARS